MHKEFQKKRLGPYKNYKFLSSDRMPKKDKITELTRNTTNRSDFMNISDASKMMNNQTHISSYEELTHYAPRVTTLNKFKKLFSNLVFYSIYF